MWKKFRQWLNSFKSKKKQNSVINKYRHSLMSNDLYTSPTSIKTNKKSTRTLSSQLLNKKVYRVPLVQNDFNKSSKRTI